MHRAWTIENHRVDLDIHAPILTVRVDGATPPALSMRSNFLGTWPIQVGGRVATLRRVRSIDVARNELWVDGVKIPPTPERIVVTFPKSGARCKVHPPSGGSRPAPTAAIECGICHSAACDECRAVDGVRCHYCFARAVEELRRRDRANRVMGPLLGVVLIAAVAFVAVAAHSRVFLRCAVGLTALLLFLMIRGLIGERLEASKVPEPKRP